MIRPFCSLTVSSPTRTIRYISSNYDQTETRLALAETSVEAAVRLRPDSGETHLARAIHFFFGYLNYVVRARSSPRLNANFPNNAEVFRVFGGMNRWEGRWRKLGKIFNARWSSILGIRERSWIWRWVYMALRKYEEADAIAKRLQALEPRSPILRTSRAGVGLEARADMPSLRAVLNTVEAEGSPSATEVADLSFRLALYERDPAQRRARWLTCPAKAKSI